MRPSPTWRRSSSQRRTDVLLRLARLYQYRGRMDDYQALLQAAARQRIARGRFYSQEQNLLAYGRLAELQEKAPSGCWRPLQKFDGTVADSPPVSPGRATWRAQQRLRPGAQYYAGALQAEESNQEALAGLAECYWKSGRARLEETLQRLMQINPNHPRAKALKLKNVSTWARRSRRWKSSGRRGRSIRLNSVFARSRRPRIF